MIKTKKDLKKCLEIEKKLHNANLFGQFVSIFGLSEQNILFRFQKYLRKWEFHLNNNHHLRGIFYKLKTTHLGYKYGIHISPNTFEEGLKIMHLGPIIVNSHARVGKYCSIHINTSLVATNGSSKAPKLGDYCCLGIGSTLIGDISLKNHVAIGAGAVVTKSFDGCHITLGGVPAKIISNRGIM